LPSVHDFPIGWFSSAAFGTTEALPPAPFGVVVKYWNNNPPENGTAAVQGYLDTAAARNVSVMMELPHRWVSAVPPALEEIYAFAAAVCDHPALLGWYMADEPDNARSWIAPAALAKVAASVRSAEVAVPGCIGRRLPISAALATLEEPGNASKVRNYNGSVDTYMFDTYPCMCTPGWHSRPGPLFGGAAFASFPSQMRSVGSGVAPQFDRFWMVLQGSVIDTAADHNHSCTTAKCWSAGWRECAAVELRNQVYAAVLAGARGLMFYRLGMAGWDSPTANMDAPLNTSWVAGVLLPVLYELTPHLPALLKGPVWTVAAVKHPNLGGGGGGMRSEMRSATAVVREVVDEPAYLPHTNTTDAAVLARLYPCPAANAPPSCASLLVALRWNANVSGAASVRHRSKLSGAAAGPPAATAVVVGSTSTSSFNDAARSEGSAQLAVLFDLGHIAAEGMTAVRLDQQGAVGARLPVAWVCTGCMGPDRCCGRFADTLMAAGDVNVYQLLTP
jgi:hypothetical protein